MSAERRPAPPTARSRLPQAAAGLGTVEGYSGYGAEQGQGKLREALAATFYPVRPPAPPAPPGSADPPPAAAARRGW